MSHIIGLRIKQIYKNKAILILALAIVVIFGTFVAGIYEILSLPQVLNIGVIDADGSEFSKEVMDNVASHPRFDQRIVTLEEGIDQLKNNGFELVYVINSGAEDKVLSGDYEGLISLYYISDNYLSPLLGDILVGKMFEAISLDAGMVLLDAALGDQVDKAGVMSQALVHSQEVKEGIERGYYLEVTMVTSDGQALDASQLDTTIMYRQMLIGIVLAFLSFYLLFCTTSIVRDYENGMIEKIGITTSTQLQVYLGHLLSIVIGGLPIVIIFGMMNGIYAGDISQGFLYMVLYLAYSFAAASMCLLLGQVVKQVSAFVVIGSSCILVLGIVSGSFFNIDLTIDAIQGVARGTYTYYALNTLVHLATFGQVDQLLGYGLTMLGFTGGFAAISLITTKY